MAAAGSPLAIRISGGRGGFGSAARPVWIRYRGVLPPRATARGSPVVSGPSGRVGLPARSGARVRTVAKRPSSAIGSGSACGPESLDSGSKLPEGYRSLRAR